MSLKESIKFRKLYDDLCKKTLRQTKLVFDDLCELYENQLYVLHKEEPGVVQIVSEGRRETQYRFKIKGNDYSLLLLQESAMIRGIESIGDQSFGEPIRYIVEKEDISRYLTGCIVLTMKIEQQHATLMRVFVNSKGEIAYEYGMGWKAPFEFEAVNDKEEKVKLFFTQPLSSSLLEMQATWSPLSEIKLIDDLKVLNAVSDRIGFN
jgi:hypothetical protein